MRLVQCQIPVRGNLQIHIDFAAEHACAEDVHLEHALLLCGALADRFLGCRIAGVVHHIVDRFPEDVHRDLEDKQADHNARNRLHHLDADQRSADTDQRSDRRQRIGTVMPGFGLQSAGADLFGVDHGIPEQAFFYGNGNHGGNQSQHAGCSRRQITAP